MADLCPGCTLLLLLLHLARVSPQSPCTGGIHGIPGIPGNHGPDGNDGPKGEKGDPGEMDLTTRGLKGGKGDRGPPGRPGWKGDKGVSGPHGPMGPPGEKGRPFNTSDEQKSFFSYEVAPQKPDTDTPINFNREYLSDLDQRLRGVALKDGRFECVIKGVYFFSYHVSVRSKVCLKLVKGSETHLLMCDSAGGVQVTSGSAVLELRAGDTVSLQVTKFNNIMTSQSSSTFTGFLIFPTA